MVLPQSPSPPLTHLYPRSLQIKLYQAFIFSIPILFSIILFLLFYLFYLKRRTTPSVPPPLSRSPRSSTTLNSLALMDLKGILKDKLPVIVVDADTKLKDPQCCVCLGEFEIKEELHQLPPCQHLFHKECICHWFLSSSTCPLCRCPIVIATKTIHPGSPVRIDQQVVSAEQQMQLGTVAIGTADCISEQCMVPAEGSSGASTSVCIVNNVSYTVPDSVVINIQNHGS